MKPKKVQTPGSYHRVKKKNDKEKNDKEKKRRREKKKQVEDKQTPKGEAQGRAALPGNKEVQLQEG